MTSRQGTLCPVGRTGRELPHRTQPMRTCVGCRQRAPKADLLRMVLDTMHEATAVPDQNGKRPGRGAYIHPTNECLELVMRRRALARAFRVSSPIGSRPVAEALPAPNRGIDEGRQGSMQSNTNTGSGSSGS